VKRRAFISILGGAAAWPFAVRAQQPARLPTIGFLGTSTPAGWSNLVTSFLERLRELGWIEGRTIAVEYRWAEGRDERYAEIATEFVRLKVDIIVTSGAGANAAKRVTSTISIVFAVANNPLGLVESLARPGGNITGLSGQQPDLIGKRLELLREVVPGVRRLAIMANVEYPAAVLEMSDTAAAAHTSGFDVVRLEIRRARDITNAFDAVKGPADALYVCADPLSMAERIRINTLAQGARMPTIHSAREYVVAGGLMSYGASLPDQFRRAAEYVDKILRGAKPGDIPVEQPTKYEFIINLFAAKALSLEIPAPLLAGADEVIE
jgi:ABC-type uncharacterized transport system substrate-binding protein